MTTPVVAAITAASTLAWIAPGSFAQSDTFNDNLIGPAWSLLQDAPSELSLSETNGRVEITASSPTSPNTDALYLSTGLDGFRLATDNDFEITLDYHLGGYDSSAATIGDLLGLTFGVGRDLDGTDSAAIGFAVSRQLLMGFLPVTTTALGAAHRTDDAQSSTVLSVPGSITGTFRIAYDTAGDDLTLGVNGDTFILEDTVQTIWDADDLLVSFGVRGNGFSLNTGETYLDNFTVVSGHVIPEPASAALLLAPMAGLLMKRRRTL